MSRSVSVNSSGVFDALFASVTLPEFLLILYLPRRLRPDGLVQCPVLHKVRLQKYTLQDRHFSDGLMLWIEEFRHFTNLIRLDLSLYCPVSFQVASP